MKRTIIQIDENKCNGCGLCIPNCPEGAIQIIDHKARLVSDLFCDGLGACIGHCPQGAIATIKREAQPYDERTVMDNIINAGPNTIKAHLDHLKSHNQTKLLSEALAVLKNKNIAIPEPRPAHQPCACPGSAVRSFNNTSAAPLGKAQPSALRQWPVQLTLLPPQAPFFDSSDLLVSADCVAHAYGGFHSQLLPGKSLAIGCPKLDDIEAYTEKLSEIVKHNNIKSLTVAIMEVPCCAGLYAAVQTAVKNSGKKIPLVKKVVTISGDIA